MTRFGLRSLRGALGTYALAAVLLVAGLVLAVALGDPVLPDLAEVELPAREGWEGGVLERSGRRVQLLPGEVVELPPGRYLLTLVSTAGEVERRELELEAGVRTLLTD